MTQLIDALATIWTWVALFFTTVRPLLPEIIGFAVAIACQFGIGHIIYTRWVPKD